MVSSSSKDDEAQWKQAVEIIDNAESCFISNIVLCELVWVLKGKPYKYSQSEIWKIIELLLQSSKLEFANRTVIYQALKFNRTGKADFADYLIGAVNHYHECDMTVTFDRKLIGEKRFRVLN